MSPLLGPILAQVVMLGVADRTEGRYIVVDQPGVGVVKTTALATMPRASLNVNWKLTALSITYTPSFTIIPLDAKSPNVIVYHSGSVSVLNRWQRTTVIATETIGYGEIDFAAQGLADPRTAPVPGTNQTPTMGANPPPGNNGNTGGSTGSTGSGAQPQPNPNSATLLRGFGTASIGTSLTSVNVSQWLSPVATVMAGVNYSVSGAIGDDPRNAQAYPVVRGPGAMLAAAYSPTFRDRVTTSLYWQLASQQNGSNAWTLSANESWSHRLSQPTTTNFGTGVSLSRNSQPNGLVSYSIYPNFTAGITYANRIDKNNISLGTNASAAPYLDPLRASVDPSVSVSGFAGLSRDRFSSSITASSWLALVSHGNESRSSTFSGALTLSYQLVSAVAVDSGVRAAWQSIGDVTTIPPGIAAFVGLTIGGQMKLAGGH